MHGQLTTPSGYTIMVSDAAGSEITVGDNISVSLSGDAADELRGYFEGLSDGGNVTMPLEKQMWGDEFGMVTDKFGIQWMVNIAGRPGTVPPSDDRARLPGADAGPGGAARRRCSSATSPTTGRSSPTRSRACREEDLRGSRLPSGWAPIELLKHLRYVELRWLEWGFEGQDVGDPWGDRARRPLARRPRRDARRPAPGPRGPGRDAPAPSSSGTRSTRSGSRDARWDGDDPPTLERVLFHLLQEYARHVGHLDVVRELIDGTTGE